MVEDAALPNASCPAGDDVFLWIIAPDSDVVRRRNVEDVAARIFLSVERFADGLDAKLRADDGNIAVVAVIGDGSLQASILEAISRFHRAGVIVIAYADAVNSWPIGVRCRVLLTGAKHLLDKGAPVFEELLSEALGSETTAFRRRPAETREMWAVARRHGLFGDSSAILDVTRQIVRFSKLSNLPVMITGESGRARHCEREIVEAAMRQVDYKQLQAARLLGLTPRSIYSKLRKYHLSRGEMPLS